MKLYQVRFFNDGNYGTSAAIVIANNEREAINLGQDRTGQTRLASVEVLANCKCK
jgi:hypothetical protein